MTQPTGQQLVREFGFHIDEFKSFVDADEGVTIDPRDQGLIAPLITGTLSGSKDISVGMGRQLPGDYHIRHHHPYGSEFYYFLSGEALVYVDGDEVQARPGTIIYLPTNCVHGMRNVSSEPTDILWGISKPEYADIGLVYDE